MFYSLGRTYDTLYVTCDNQILAELPKKDAIKAHCVQFSSLYNYGIRFDTSSDGKPLPEANAFFTFVTTYCGINQIPLNFKALSLTLTSLLFQFSLEKIILFPFYFLAGIFFDLVRSSWCTFFYPIVNWDSSTVPSRYIVTSFPTSVLLVRLSLKGDYLLRATIFSRNTFFKNLNVW